MSGTPNLERFGRIVRERREHLGYQQDTMPHGPSSTTVSDIENADITGLAAKTFRKLDESLQWEAGSARRTYEGGDPTPIESRVPLELKTVPIDDLLDEIRRRVIALESDRDMLGPIPSFGDSVQVMRKRASS